MYLRQLTEQQYDRFCNDLAARAAISPEKWGPALRRPKRKKERHEVSRVFLWWTIQDLNL